MPAVAAGLLGGALGALAMILAQLVLRVLLGIAPPPEALPDRFAPTLTIAQFFGLLDLFGGYNALKQLGVGSVLVGQVSFGMLVGVGYARLTARTTHAARWIWVGIGLVWLAFLVVLWPVLSANYLGLPAPLARPLSALGLLLSFAAFGATLLASYRWLRQSSAAASHRPGSRRAALGLVGATALAVASGGLLRRLFDQATFGYDGREYRGADLQHITPSDRFYSVTKNVVDPRPDRGLWRLEIGGQVDRPASYSFDELRARASVRQETTLMCISNYVGGGLISNAVWTGVPLRVLLEAASPRAGAVEVVCHAADGYTDTFNFEKAMAPTTLVAIEMNGEPLPDRHGFPGRLIVPGLFGEKNVKWVTRIEVIDHDAKGFYEQQGWGPSFVIPTRSQHQLDEIAARAGETVVLSGWAFGGDRGVSRAEVSVDGGSTWQPARLTAPGTRLSWAFWELDWRPPAPGEYRLLVRCVDGTGAAQPTDYRDTAPEGATGLHAITARVT